MHDINQFDFAFIVDSTSSMGSFISTAKAVMIDMIKTLTKNADIDMKIGVVAYRDHPPQDTVIVEYDDFATPDIAQKNVNKLSPQGGGDGPEAVYDGIITACKKLTWRYHSRKIAVLIGDAPPHGCGMSGDGFPKGCPCGDTTESSAAACEENNITLYAVPLTSYANESFKRLANLTGGKAYDASQATQAVKNIQDILTLEFGNLDLDRRVIEIWDNELTTDEIAEKLEAKPTEVAASISRLGSRGLLKYEELVAA
jgi:hypothetical protein